MTSVCPPRERFRKCFAIQSGTRSFSPGKHADSRPGVSGLIPAFHSPPNCRPRRERPEKRPERAAPACSSRPAAARSEEVAASWKTLWATAPHPRVARGRLPGVCAWGGSCQRGESGVIADAKHPEVRAGETGVPGGEGKRRARRTRFVGAIAQRSGARERRPRAARGSGSPGCRGRGGRRGPGRRWGRRQDLRYLPSLLASQLTAPRCAELEPGTKKQGGEGS